MHQLAIVSVCTLYSRIFTCVFMLIPPFLSSPTAKHHHVPEGPAPSREDYQEVQVAGNGRDSDKLKWQLFSFTSERQALATKL